MKKADNNGSVLMECVLVMPILLFIILGIAQLSYIWVAKLMTHYAAYSAARAAIVYNPADYRNGNDFFADKGPVHQAACIALAKMGGHFGDPAIEIPGWGKVTGSEKIFEQVRISGRDLSNLTQAEKDAGQVAIPAVEVTVAFDFPLLVPYVDFVIGMFANGGKDLKWHVTGYEIPDPQRVRRVITLKESCIMAQPWKTEGVFPTVAEKDRADWRLE